ncbi:UNKNOWN [Stylonychia lemnae]|uniref:Duf229 domain containing protein n=1 Tax=Stylonychia lemnae TaxID=5949 RepID=A0A077ZWF1_STYLE|nr:UNKNOWN [Stylonychia lemnae]|eukprot:CDW73595.1 UNKNOWN [Stylonychia lemnae]
MLKQVYQQIQDYNTKSVDQMNPNEIKRYSRFRLIRTVIRLIIANILYVWVQSDYCGEESRTECILNHHIPKLPEWVVIHIAGCALFIYELHRRQKDLRNGVRMVNDIAIFVLVCANILVLIFTFNTVTQQNIGGVYTSIFVLLLFIYGCVLISQFAIDKTRLLIGKARTSLILTFLVLFVVRYIHTKFILSSCDNWLKGISQDLDQGNEASCKIPEPGICPFEMTNGILDLSAYLREFQCEYQVNRLSYFERFYKTNKTYIAHPLSKFFELQQRHISTYPYQIVKHSVGYDTLEDAIKNNHEVIVDTKNEKMIINVPRNETLAQERRKIAKKVDRGDLTQNVLLVFIDTLSRQRLHDKLPKTVQFFRERDHKEFFRLHSYWGRTQENAFPYLFGKTLQDFIENPPVTEDQEIKMKPPPKVPQDNLFSYFKEQGFITSWTGDLCETGMFSQKEFYDQYVKNAATDHEGLSSACDPNLYDFNSPHGDYLGSYSSSRRCLYKRDSYEFPFEYAKQFFKAYETENKVMMMTFMDMHEGTIEVIKYLDNPLTNFLKEMEDENTTIILWSDHGLHLWGLIESLSRSQTWIEVMNPFIVINNLKGLTKEQEQNLEINQQKLVTHIHFHNFLKFFASGKVPENPMNLVNKLGSDKEVCDQIGTRCICENFPKSSTFQRWPDV